MPEIQDFFNNFQRMPTLLSALFLEVCVSNMTLVFSLINIQIKIPIPNILNRNKANSELLRWKYFCPFATVSQNNSQRESDNEFCMQKDQMQTELRLNNLTSVLLCMACCSYRVSCDNRDLSVKKSGDVQSCGPPLCERTHKEHKILFWKGAKQYKV